MVPSKVKESAGINFEIENAYFNPFTFELELTNPLLKDLSNAPVFGLEHLYVNVEPIDIVTQSITLKALKLKAPQIYVTLDSEGKANVANIMPPSKEGPKKEDTPSEPSSFTFLVELLDIAQGKVIFKDNSKATPFTFVIEPLDYHARDISTKKDNVGAHRFEATSSYIKRIAWEGGVLLDPLKFYGEVWLDDVDVAALTSYGMDGANIAIKRGLASTYLPYAIELKETGPVILIDGARFTLNDLLVNDGENKLAQLGQLNIRDLHVDTTIAGKSTYVDLKKLHVNAAHALVYEPDGSQMAKLNNLSLKNIKLNTTIEESSTVAALFLDNFQASGASIFTPSGLKVEGGFERLSLPSIQGDILTGKDKEPIINVSLPSILLEKLNLNHPQSTRAFAGFNTFKLTDIALKMPEQKVTVESTDLNALFANAIMKKDGSIDLASISPKSPSKQKTKTEPSTPSKPWNYAVKSISIDSAKASFSDLTLATPVTHILTDIDVNIKEFDSDFKTPFSYNISLSESKKNDPFYQG